MALVEKTGGPRTHVGHSEPEALAADVETTPLASSHYKPHFNGAAKLAMEDVSDEYAITAFFKRFHPIILGAIIGVIGSLAGSGFILKPATTASVDELKTAFQAYIERHDRVDSIRNDTINSSLKEIHITLKEMADKAVFRELQQVRMEARVEDVLRFLAVPPAASPAISDPAYIVPKPKPEEPTLRTKSKVR